MARKPRIEFPGAFYHVIARGNHKQKLFLDDGDYKNFLKRLKSYKERFKFILYAYTLMPNHIHLLIETGDTPLSKIMQALQFSYAQKFNRKYNKVGHLFQSRYKAILCQKENYLLELIRYITLNPCRAHLVDDPIKWPWSSYLDIVRSKDGHIVSVDDVLALFGQQRASAVRAFQRYINDGLSEGHKEDYYKLKDQRILGEDGFAEEVIKQKGEGDDFEYYAINIEETVKLVAKHMDIGIDEIKSVARNRLGAKARSLVAYVCKTMGGITARKISRYFRRSGATISKAIKTVESEERGNGIYGGPLQKIRAEIKRCYNPCLVRDVRQRQNKLNSYA